MLRHTWMVVIAALLALIGLGAAAFYFEAQPTILRVAVGPPNSEDVRVIQAVAQQFARDRATIRLRLLIKDGPRQAAAALDSGAADLAVVRRDVAMPQAGQAVAILRKNLVVLIAPPPPPAPPAPPASAQATGEAAPAKKTAAKEAAPKKTAAREDESKKSDAEEDEGEKPAAKKAKGQKSAGKKEKAKKSAGKEEKDKKAAGKEEDKDASGKEDGVKKIEKIEDLVGKHLAVIGRSEANIKLLDVILQQYGIPPDKIVVMQLDTTDVGTRIRESKVDAIMSVGPLGSRITADAVAAASREKEPPTFLAIDASEAIAERYPVYESAEIAAGTFGGNPQKPPEAIETIGVSHYIVARKTLDDSTAGEFTRLLLGARQSLASELPAIGKIEAPDTEKGAAVAVHPGAAAFIDGEQKSFFERYNDWIYYGLMVMSFVGSAAAWLMNYTKVDDRVKKLVALDRLLELMRAARQAPTLEALEQAQAETDEILHNTILQVENEKLDQAALQAFALALEQTRAAIAERRAALAAAAAPAPAATPAAE